MRGKTRVSKGKQMKPNFFVFCEGETEVEYVKYLRSLYRVPIQVIPKKSKSNITVEDIERSKRDYVGTEQDRVFLMFDLDVDGMLIHLMGIPNAILLVSNPCIELWFLLHFQDRKSSLSTEECFHMMRRVSNGYRKGSISYVDKQVLASNEDIAVARARELIEYENPSSTVYRLIELLKQYK